ncbi:site-2 protease family protein [Candidatus Peregrinibacteria bacterium]|nr:site-2 protease family protein [Candidatus Peregrinibacteria bacterium]
MIIVTIIAFLVVFSVLILVHEIGHFVMARKAGIKVEEFGIGLPPKAKVLFKDKHGTAYTLNWIPFGGFVRMYGEDSYDPKIVKDNKSFASKSILRRTSVIVAGVVMNFILAWVIITIGFTFGMKPFLVTDSDLEVAVESGIVEVQDVLYIHEIIPESPISSTNLKEGDLILEINGDAVTGSTDLSSMFSANQMVGLKAIVDGEEQVINVNTNDNAKLGFTLSNEQVVVDVKNISYPIYQAPYEAIKEVGRLSVLTVQMLGDVIVSLVAKFTVPENVAGPVGIAKMTHYFVQQGLMAVLQFTALISISLGVINIMPFPALDGGRFLFIVFEAITRKKPSAKWEALIHSTGFVLLMGLIFIITWNDILNLFK